MEYDIHDYCAKEIELDNDLEVDQVEDIVFEEKQGDELLIDLIRSYPFLYDKTNSQYKDKNMKEASWSEIGRILNVAGQVGK